ncbi:MAG: SH3 domain-containing protein, partial [Pseudomonadota bacterium]
RGPKPVRRRFDAEMPKRAWPRAAVIGVGALALSLVLWATPSLAQPSSTDTPPSKGSVTGLKLPRFVSLKASEVNLRRGPGTDYATAWVFRRAGLPVEVIREYDVWRQVRDADGTTGWIIRSLLSGRRTGRVKASAAGTATANLDGAPQQDDIGLFERSSERSRLVAKLAAGVLADLHECDGRWCRVTVARFRGYMRQDQLWGAYPGEVFR